MSRQGTLTIRWVFLPWSSSLNALLREAVICLPTAYAPGAFELATAIADLRERLAIFGTSNDRANAVRAALDAKPIHPPDSVFDFSFSKPGVNHIGGRKWVRVDSEKKFEAVMKAAKENTFGLLLIRVRIFFFFKQGLLSSTPPFPAHLPPLSFTFLGGGKYYFG